MSEKYIIDASVAVKWFYEEPLHQEARLYFDSTVNLVAPELIKQEFVNAIVKKVRCMDVNPDEGWQSYQDLFNSDTLELLPTDDFLEEAYKLAVSIKHPVYDCIYLAAAKQLNIAVVTADQKFFNQVHKHSKYANNIQRVEIPPVEYQLEESSLEENDEQTT